MGGTCSCGGNFGEQQENSPSSIYEATGGKLACENNINVGNDVQGKEPAQEINETNSHGCSKGDHPNSSENHSKDDQLTQNKSNICGSLMITSIKGHHYNMDNNRSGLAIIFNHYIFDHDDKREGTHCDENRLREVLSKLGFDIKSYTDLTLDEIHAVIEEAQKEKFEDIDCFIMAVLSHGTVGGLVSAKDYEYSFSTLWKSFTDDKCLSLKGKPRLFFIQTCREKQGMDPVMLNHLPETDGILYSSPIPNVPEHFLVAYATGEGYYSWRSRSSGSWFIQSLCEMLEKYAYLEDINHILTRVLREVAIGFETNTPGNDETHKKKQMPCVVTKLTRLLLFKNKLLDGSVHN